MDVNRRNVMRILLNYTNKNTKESHLLLLLLLLILLVLSLILPLLLTGIDLSLGGSSPHTSTDKTNKNKYT